VILDACRDNPFARQLLVSQPGRALSPRGLLSVEPPNSVLVAFAAKHGTTADDGSGRNSPFTTAPLHNLETPGLEINYLFRNIHDEVYEATQRRQEPYVYGTLSREPIYLKAVTGSAPATAAAASHITSPPNLESEVEAARTWDQVKETNSSEVLNKFIQRYGGTIQGALARERLATIAGNPSVPVKPNDRQPIAPASPSTAPQVATAQPATEATAAPAAGSGTLPPNLAAFAGHWTWRTECPIFGNFHGEMAFRQSKTNQLTGAAKDAGKSDWREMFDLRIRDENISFRIKVDGGATQHWKGILSHRQNGQYLLQGTGTDSRFAIGSCSLVATKD
jgi:hypothetical protein